MPPAHSRSSITVSVAGSSQVSCGVTRLSRSKSAIVMSTWASWAMAGMCSVVLVEPPSAMSMRMAFSSDCFVTILRAVTPSRTSATMRSPAACASRIFFDDPASADAVPVRLKPIASVRHAIVLAVYRPWQEPSPGQASISIFSASSSVILPAWQSPTASKVFRTRASLRPR